MSRIYFHSMGEDCEISGRERAYFGCQISSIATAIFDPKNNKKYIKAHLPADCSLQISADHNFNINFWAHLNMGDGAFIFQGQKLAAFDIMLNTVLKTGSPAIKLMARIHGQCEVYGYVEGENRAWLANIIKQARKDNIFRSEVGWENLISFLERNNTDPVVMSYSVTDQFPSMEAANWDKDGDEIKTKEWYKLSDEKRWELAMAGLRRNADLFELNPLNFDTFVFLDGVSAFDIINGDKDQ